MIGISHANTKASTTAYDPTCGSGSLLLKVAAEADRQITLEGQEKDVTTAGLARMNMILHDFPSATILSGDTLVNPKFKDGEQLRAYDYVVANPPFSDKKWSTGLNPANDPYLRFTWGEMKGFSPRNLKYMRAFAEAWPDAEIVQQAAAQLPWGHNLVLLDRLKAPTERLAYALAVIEHGWSRNVLNIHIETRLVELIGKGQLTEVHDHGKELPE